MKTIVFSSSAPHYSAPESFELPYSPESAFLDASALVEGITDDENLYTWE